MGESILTNRSKKIEFILVFLFFTSIILFLTLSGYTFLGIQDEVQLQSTLSAGDPKNYMMSYPLSVFVSFLYTKASGIPWYSILMLLYISLISLLMTLYIVKLDYNKYLKYFLLLLFTLLLIFILFDISITLLTFLLIVFSVPLIPNNQFFFWFLLYLASFLRVEIILSLLPLFILTYMIFMKKTFFTSKNIFIILLFAVAILTNHYSSSMNKEYKEWLQFTKDRLYFTDLDGPDKNHILTDDEYQLARSWWICDLELYPVDKIPQAAGSTIDVVTYRIFSKNSILKLLRKIYHNKILIILILLTAYIVFLEKNNFRRSYLLLFMLAFFALLLVRDAQRTTFPIVILWSMILFLEYYKRNKIILLNSFLLSISIYIIIETPWRKVIDYQQNEQLVKEFKDLAHRNNMKLEIPSGFTSSYELIVTVLKQNHLLQEKKWVDYNNYLLLSGWFTMHPLCLKQHDISFKKTKRKYNTYYEYLLDSKTGIIGSKNTTHINPFLSNNLLRMYDEKFTQGTDCLHKVKVVDQSNHFIINQIVKVCEQKNSIHAKDKNISTKIH